MKARSRKTTEGVIKSAGRAISVLELFREVQRPLTARDLAEKLDMPRSSTNALLASLMSLGYIWFNLKDNTYFPTLRVGQLGYWLFDSFNEDTRLTGLLEDLSRETRETIALAIQVGSSMQFLRVLGGTHPIALNVQEGFKAPLFTSAVGWALLCALTVPEVGSLVAAHNARRSEKGERVNLDDLLAQLVAIRKRGAAIAYEAVLPDTGAVAVGIRDILHDQPVAITIGGLEARMRENEEAIVQALRRVFTRHRLLAQSTLAASSEGSTRGVSGIAAGR